MKKLFKFKNNKQVIIDVYSQEEFQRRIEDYKNSIRFANYNEVMELVDEEISKYEKIKIDNVNFYVDKNNFECEYIHSKKFNFIYFFQTMIISLIIPWFGIINYIHKNPKKKNLEEIKNFHKNVLYIISIGICLPLIPVMIRLIRFTSVIGFYLSFISFLLPYEKFKKLGNKDFKINKNKIVEIDDYNENEYINSKIKDIQDEVKKETELEKEIKITFVEDYKNIQK